MLSENVKQGCNWLIHTQLAKANYHPPAHHAGWMVCGHETLFHCIHVLQDTTVLSHALAVSNASTYQVVIKLPHILTYVNSNHLHHLLLFSLYSCCAANHIGQLCINQPWLSSRLLITYQPVLDFLITTWCKSLKI